MPQLVIFVEGDYPQINELSDDKITIGRSSDNLIAIVEPSVSARHARLERREDGAIQLIDLDSANGTRVNGSKVTSTPLVHEDRIKFGQVGAVYLDWDTPSPTDESSMEGTARITAIPLPGSPSKADTSLRNRAADLGERVENSRKELESVHAEIKKTLEEKESQEKALKKLEDERAKDEKDAAEKKAHIREELKILRQSLTELKESAEEKQKALKQLESEVGKKEEVIAGAKQDIEKLESTKRATSEKIAEGEDKIRSLEKSSTALDNEIGRRKSDLEKLEKKIESRQKDQEKLLLAIQENETEKNELKGSISQKRETLEGLLAELEQRRKESENLVALAKANEEKVEKAKKDLKEIESRRQSALDETSRTTATRKSLEEECHSIRNTILSRTRALHRIDGQLESRQEESMVASPPLRVIDPRLRSLLQFFYQDVDAPGKGKVNAIGRCALAACTHGSVHREVDTVPAGEDPVLLLLSGDLDEDGNLVQSVSEQLPGRSILACWHEGFPWKVQDKNVKDWPLDGVITIDLETQKTLESFSLKCPHLRIQLPYPMESADWDLSTGAAARKPAIFVSAEGFNPESATHRKRLELIRRLVAHGKLPITLYFESGESRENLGDFSGAGIDEIEGPIPFVDFAESVSRHRFLSGFGKNPDGGHLLGDAVMTGTILVGGADNPDIEEILFPDTCPLETDPESILEAVGRILADEKRFTEITSQAKELAPPHLSFEAVNARLGEWIIELRG